MYARFDIYVGYENISEVYARFFIYVGYENISEVYARFDIYVGYENIVKCTLFAMCTQVMRNLII